jgi:hypothetical protein
MIEPLEYKAHKIGEGKIPGTYVTSAQEEEPDDNLLTETTNDYWDD